MVALLVLGTAETFADWPRRASCRASSAEDLGIANARLQAAYILANQLVGPPIGAFLFVVGMAVPFAADAVVLRARGGAHPRIAVAAVAPSARRAATDAGRS